MTDHGAEMLQMAELSDLLKEGIASGEVQPLPFKIYGPDDVPAAFRFMASGVQECPYSSQCSMATSQPRHRVHILTSFLNSQNWRRNPIHTCDGLQPLLPQHVVMRASFFAPVKLLIWNVLYQQYLISLRTPQNRLSELGARG